MNNICYIPNKGSQNSSQRFIVLSNLQLSASCNIAAAIQQLLNGALENHSVITTNELLVRGLERLRSTAQVKEYIFSTIQDPSIDSRAHLKAA